MRRCTCTLCHPQEISAAARSNFSPPTSPSYAQLSCSACFCAYGEGFSKALATSLSDQVPWVRLGLIGADAWKGPKVASFGMLGSLTASSLAKALGCAALSKIDPSHPRHLYLASMQAAGSPKVGHQMAGLIMVEPGGYTSEISKRSCQLQHSRLCKRGLNIASFYTLTCAQQQNGQLLASAGIQEWLVVDLAPRPEVVLL